MANRRKFSSHRAPVNCIREQLLNKSAHVIFARIQQCALASVKKPRELADVARICRNRKCTEAFLNFQIIDERRKDAGIGLRRHNPKYARYRTLVKVTNQVLQPEFRESARAPVNP